MSDTENDLSKDARNNQFPENAIETPHQLSDALLIIKPLMKLVCTDAKNEKRHLFEKTKKKG